MNEYSLCNRQEAEAPILNFAQKRFYIPKINSLVYHKERCHLIRTFVERLFIVFEFLQYNNILFKFI
ncbi:hypothetical protein SAMN05518846_10473 [Brevibacillus centrosporus]|uniref:Uncharacterized protein n=1 Tax=Brevibacillus centrosporus TaxID=54910 RepID=A0A1I3SA57_9BACL|nr:hypothetical protein SAMN05518846_10473 [Brevibacillus centrosporus]